MNTATSITLTAELLSKYINSIAKFITANPLIPAYEYVKIEVVGGHLCFTAGSEASSVTRRLPIEGGEGFGFCVEYAAIRGATATMSAEVTLDTSEEGFVSLNSSKGSITMATIPVIDYPKRKIDAGEPTLMLSPAESESLAQALRRTGKFCTIRDFQRASFMYTWLSPRTGGRQPLLVGASNAFIYAEAVDLNMDGVEMVGIPVDAIHLFASLLLSKSPTTIYAGGYREPVVSFEPVDYHAPRGIHDQRERPKPLPTVYGWITMTNELDSVSYAHLNEADGKLITNLVTGVIDTKQPTTIRVNHEDLDAITSQSLAMPHIAKMQDQLVVWKANGELRNNPAETSYIAVLNIHDYELTGEDIVGYKGFSAPQLSRMLDAIDSKKLTLNLDPANPASALHFESEGGTEKHYITSNTSIIY